ncbi:hypothetical protein BC833DRAFT_647091 [Globomyces pollinis-pini]|nr:hypothetical protein BC833DRAFT_647091 [Globomyces pollinis-pini]
MILNINYEDTVTILKILGFAYNSIAPLLLFFAACKFKDVSISGVFHRPLTLLKSNLKNITTARGFTYFVILIVLLMGDVSEFFIQRLATRNIYYKPATGASFTVSDILQDTYIDLNSTMANPKQLVNNLIKVSNTPSMIDLSQSIGNSNSPINLADASFEEGITPMEGTFTFRHGHFAMSIYPGIYTCSSFPPSINSNFSAIPSGSIQSVCSGSFGSAGYSRIPRINDRSSDFATFLFGEGGDLNDFISRGDIRPESVNHTVAVYIQLYEGETGNEFKTPLYKIEVITHRVEMPSSQLSEDRTERSLHNCLSGISDLYESGSLNSTLFAGSYSGVYSKGSATEQLVAISSTVQDKTSCAAYRFRVLETKKSSLRMVSNRYVAFTYGKPTATRFSSNLDNKVGIFNVRKMHSITCNGADSQERTKLCIEQSRVIGSLTNSGLARPIVLEQYENTEIGVLGLCLLGFMFIVILSALASRVSTNQFYTQSLTSLLLDSGAQSGVGKNVPIEHSEGTLYVQDMQVCFREKANGIREQKSVHFKCPY